MAYAVYRFEPVCDVGCCVLGVDMELFMERNGGGPAHRRPMFELLPDGAGGSQMRVFVKDYQDTDRWWL